MNKILSWSDIVAKYNGQWVELVDYDWAWNTSYPRWARVRNHSFSRLELVRAISGSEKVTDSITLFLGAVGSTVDWTEAAAVM